MPKRCLFGCPRSEVPTHAFPHPERFPDTFKAWVAIVGGRLESPEDWEFYRKKRICDIHFTEGDRNRNNRLNALAVPSLWLTSKQAPTERAATVVSVSARPESMSMDAFEPSTSAHSLSGKPAEQAGTVVSVSARPEAMSLDIFQPSTSAHNLSGKPAEQAGTVVSVAARPESMSMDISQPSTSAHSLPGKQVQAEQATRVFSVAANPESMSMDILQPSTSAHSLPGQPKILSEHNYFKREVYKDKNSGRYNLVARREKKFNIRENKTQQWQIRNLKSQIKRLRKQGKAFKARLASAEKMNDSTALKRVIRNMTSPAKLFTRMQFTQTTKKPSGRRFSLEEKILSLSLYKRSRKCYALLAHCFTLPSAKTLKTLLAQIKLGSGLIDVVFNNLKTTIQQMTPEDKLCSLVFDEMYLTPQIHYDCTKDKLFGFSDFNEKKIADHVLVFMVKGVKANFKQPVAYYFTNTVNKIDLKNLIIKVIKKLQATGLIVISTVCDQGTANVSAVNELVQEAKNEYFQKGKAWRHSFFQVNNQQIVPLFDVPHLLKCLRNNLLKNHLLYVDEDGIHKTVKWEYFRQVYEADKNLGELKLLHKITEEHLDPEKIKKMRVKSAAQIFSHSIAVVTEHLAARKLIDEQCRQLIPFVLLIDNLFDSLNASSLHIPNGKIYKGCVKKNSPHHVLWQKAIKMLKTMKFILKKKSKSNQIRLIESVSPTIKNFIKTIEGMEALWTILSKKYLLDCMMTRHFNQDPLENFFGNIRSYNARNTSPNCMSFEGAYKALLLNNFNSPHSNQANCEKDENVCLQNLNFFCRQKNKENKTDVFEQEENLYITEDILLPNDEEENNSGVRNYVSGWVLKKCLTNVIKGCKNCKSQLVCKEENEKNQFIKLKEYNKKKKWLVYPSEDCERTFREMQDITVSILKKNVPKTDLKKYIKSVIHTIVYFPCNCRMHYDKLRKYFEDLTIHVVVYSWCRSINRILCGKINYTGEDEMKNIAQLYYIKHKHNKTKK